jgi:hypothetical protein
MGSERICVCGKKVSSMRRSDWCSSICKRQHDYENRKEKLKGSRITTFVLVHHCIRPELQMGETPDPLACGCREEMSAEDLKARIGRGEIVLVGSEGYACYSSKLRRAPRAQTIEKAHMERANLSKDSRKYGGKSLKELQAAVDEDKASRALEEQVRIEVFHQIEKEERRKLTREYTESEFYAYDRENWGRAWSTQPGDEDQRTKGGIGIDRPKGAANG